MVAAILAAGDVLSGPVKDSLALPLINAGQFLIPAAVGMSGLHKLLSHQESGAGFLTDVLVKGGGAWLLLQVVRTIAGI